jgi:metal-responsive CopG/Arc/MetJ family transcriptional regulator
MTFTGLKMVGIRLPPELIFQIDELRNRKYTDRSNFVREALIHFISFERKRLAALDAETKAYFAENEKTEAA